MNWHVSSLLFILFFSVFANAQVDTDFSAGGGIRVGTSTSTCDGTLPGAIRYNSGNLEYCNGVAWLATLSSSISGVVNGGNSFGGAMVIGTNDNFNLSLETNNVTRMTLDTSGNVGIGTATPTALLDAYGNSTNSFVSILSGNAANYSGFQLGRTAAEGQLTVVGSANQFLTGTAAGDMVLRNADGTKKVYIGSGTSTGAVSIQQFIAGGTGAWINIPTTGPSGIGTGGAGTNPWIGYASQANNWFTGSAAGDVVYRNTSGRLLFGVTSGNPSMTLATNGNFGIGTITPTSKLTVAGDVNLNATGNLYRAFNEDSVKLKFANWYLSNADQFGQGQLWNELWFGAINGGANRRIGFYLEQPNAGSSNSGGTATAHPSNARMYIDVNETVIPQNNLRVASGQIKTGVVNTTSATPFTYDADSGHSMLWTTDEENPVVNIHNASAGGRYSVVIKGAGTGLAAINCYSDGGTTSLPVSFVPVNGTRMTGTASKTIYSVYTDGENCLVNWITGF